MVKKDTVLVGGISNDINVPPRVLEVCIDCPVKTQLAAARARLSKVMALINEQAEDEALWFNPHSTTEAYLQQALRRLHAAIEGD